MKMSVGHICKMVSMVRGHNVRYFLVTKEEMLESANSIHHMVSGAWYGYEIQTEVVQNCEYMLFAFGDGHCNKCRKLGMDFCLTYNN